MKQIDNLIIRKPILTEISGDIEKAIILIEESLKNNGKLLICGNGGSASDSAHIMGELVKSFCKKRAVDKKVLDNLKLNVSDKEYQEYEKNLEGGAKVIDLTSFASLNTAFSNDKNYDFAFANSVLSLGEVGDVLLAISTSGNSKSIITASNVAKAKGMKVVALTGNVGGKLKEVADVSIVSPEKETYLIQEDHESIYHAICLQIEEDIL